MFTLRRITGDGVQINTELGSKYNYIDRFASKEAFERIYRKAYGDNVETPKYNPDSENDEERIFAFIENESLIQPLWCNQKSYIMTDGGKTFSRLSYWNK